MGAWSETIMGSDDALDAEGDIIVDICEIDHDEWLDKEPKDFRTEIENCIPIVIKKYEDRGDDSYIHFQVLGVLIMESGSKTTLDVINTILKHTEHDDSERFLSPEKRKAYIDDFRTNIQNYDLNGGTIVELEHEGLFEVMFAKMPKSITE